MPMATEYRCSPIAVGIFKKPHVLAWVFSSLLLRLHPRNTEIRDFFQVLTKINLLCFQNFSRFRDKAGTLFFTAFQTRQTLTLQNIAREICTFLLDHRTILFEGP
jgi:hypothetical protein